MESIYNENIIENESIENFDEENNFNDNIKNL